MRIPGWMARFLFQYFPRDVALGRFYYSLPGISEDITEATTPLRGFPLQMTYNPHTGANRWIYYRGLYEEEYIARIRGLLKTGETFLDIGANYGLYTIVGAHLVGSQGRVLSFEPQPTLVQWIERNIVENDLSNVDVVPVALGKTASQGTLYFPVRNDGAATLNLNRDESEWCPSIRVPVASLASVLDRQGITTVDGMKIDVEGAELQVLQGYGDLWNKKPPKFIQFEAIESNLTRFDATIGDLFSFLHDRDYRLEYFRRGTWHTVRKGAKAIPVCNVLAVHSC